MNLTRPRIPGVSPAIVVGVDWGATTGLAALVLTTGELLGTDEVVKSDARKARPGKPATKKRPAIEPQPAVETWETWARWAMDLKAELVRVLEPGDVVALEDPGAHMRRDGWLSHGRARCVCEIACAMTGATLVCVPTNRAKIVAAGHGRAEKSEMQSAACVRWPGFSGMATEHTIDACWNAETARLGRE